MKRHEADIFSLIAGLTFTAIAVVYLIASLNDRSVNGRIVIPVALISLGTAGLAGAVTRVARRNRQAAAETAAAEGPEWSGSAEAYGEPVGAPGERPLSEIVEELEAEAHAADGPRRPPGPSGG